MKLPKDFLYDGPHFELAQRTHDGRFWFPFDFKPETHMIHIKDLANILYRAAHPRSCDPEPEKYFHQLDDIEHDRWMRVALECHSRIEYAKNQVMAELQKQKPHSVDSRLLDPCVDARNSIEPSYQNKAAQ